MNTQAQASKSFPGNGLFSKDIEDKEFGEQVNKAGEAVFDDLKKIIPFIEKTGRRLVTLTVSDVNEIPGTVLAVAVNGGHLPLDDIAKINLANFKGVSDGAIADEETGIPVTQPSLGVIVVCRDTEHKEPTESVAQDGHQREPEPQKEPE